MNGQRNKNDAREEGVEWSKGEEERKEASTTKEERKREGERSVDINEQSNLKGT